MEVPLVEGGGLGPPGEQVPHRTRARGDVVPARERDEGRADERSGIPTEEPSERGVDPPEMARHVGYDHPDRRQLEHVDVRVHCGQADARGGCGARATSGARAGSGTRERSRARARTHAGVGKDCHLDSTSKRYREPAGVGRPTRGPSLTSGGMREYRESCRSRRTRWSAARPCNDHRAGVEERVVGDGR